MGLGVIGVKLGSCGLDLDEEGASKAGTVGKRSRLDATRDSSVGKSASEESSCVSSIWRLETTPIISCTCYVDVDPCIYWIYK